MIGSANLPNSKSGWVTGKNGFSGLSKPDQVKATASHQAWQESNPRDHTFGVEDYVSYAQERNQFVNR